MSFDENYKDFTIEEVFKALEENGFEHLRSQWYAEDIEGYITGGCVLGQAALNLGTESEGSYGLLHKLNSYLVDIDSPWRKYPSSDERLFPDYDAGLGNVIITWNDATVTDDAGKESWVLPTYRDVTKMAKEVMEPYFKEVITLETRKWNYRKAVTV